MDNSYPGVETRFDNTSGSTIYRFEQVINCSVRKTEPVIATVAENTKSEQEVTNAEVEEQDKEDVEGPPVSTEAMATGDKTSQTWRLISAVKAWPTSDFPYPQLVDYGYNNAEALKGIVNLVNTTKPDLLWNHSHDVHDVAGYVDNAFWEDSQDIPVGVNADLVVDAEFDKKAALGLEKGFIRNGSIGVVMDCKPSHDNMKFSEFVENQGKTVNGQEVRWLPIAVHSVRHMAMVAAGTGADPNAGRRIMQNSNNVEEKEITTETQMENGRKDMTDFVSLLSKLAEGLGVEVALSEEGDIPEGLDERLVSKIGKLSGLTEKYNSVCTRLEALEDAIGAPSKEESIEYLRSKLSLAKHGEKLLEHYRKEATRWFDSAKTAIGKTDLSDSDKRMRNRIVKSEDLDYLEDIISEYREITESTLSNKRVSEGLDLPKEKTEPSQKDKDIAASVAALFK